MSDPLVVTFPGSAFKAQMLSLQKVISNSINRQEVLPISVIMDYVNLTQSNTKLNQKLIERGSMIPNGVVLSNDYTSTLYERLYDMGEQLKEVYLQFPKKVKIRITEPATQELIMDFTEGDKVIFIAKGLPESTGLSESFIMVTIKFHENGTETILKEEFGEGIIKIQVDYTKSMDSKLIVKYNGNSFRARFFNTMASTLTDDPCCPNGPVTRPREGRGFIDIHVKIIYPLSIPYQVQVDNTNVWLDAYNLEIRIKSVTNLQQLTQFQTLDLRLANPMQSCLRGQTSLEQNDLYKNYRGAIPANEIAVYYVYNTIPAYGGCASHPQNFPSAVLTNFISMNVLAHELCHVLGLNHVNNDYQLMTQNGVSNISSPPPDLTGSELDIIWKSPYLKIIK